MCIRDSYRLFNIPAELSGNDIGSLQHVLERRIKYYVDPDLKPDVILIDGGKNQLNFVNTIINKSDHRDIKVISIVKGSKRVRATETIISEDGIIELDKYSKAFLILQEIRNESHRFAIRAQRNKKRKKISQSELDSIKGIGEILKKRLLTKFKSIQKIKSADIKELMTTEGINEKMATKINQAFK